MVKGLRHILVSDTDFTTVIMTTHTRAHVCICICVCLYICVSVYMYVSMSMYECMYVSVCLYVYTCILINGVVHHLPERTDCHIKQFYLHWVVGNHRVRGQHHLVLQAVEQHRPRQQLGRHAIALKHNQRQMNSTAYLYIIMHTYIYILDISNKRHIIQNIAILCIGGTF